MRVKTPSFGGRAVGKARSRGFMASVGVAGLLLAVLTSYVGYQAAYSVPGRGYYNIKAEFVDANNLANHYEVRLGGVRAGQVLDPRVENGKAVVDIRLDDEFKPLRSDSQLAVRLRSAVGVRYLEIIPGTSGRILEEGDTISSRQVTDSVALDEVLGTFDTDTRAATSQLLKDLGNGTAGRGTDLNEVIREAPGLLTDLRSVSNAVTSRPGRQLSGFIRNGNEAAGAFDAARNDIVAGFKPQKQALEIFSDAKDDLQGTLRTAAPALGSLSQTLPNVNRLLRATEGLARRSRPTFAVAPASLRAATGLLNNAEQPLDDLEDTLDLAESAVNPTLDLLGKVRPVLPTVDDFVGSVMPQLTELGPKACETSNLLHSWANILTIGNDETNFIRFHLKAVRPEQTAGQQSKGSPELDQLYDGLINKDPYFGPCRNGGSEPAAGRQPPVPAKVLSAGKKPFNNSDNKPFETDPNIVSSASQIIGGN